MLTRLGNLRKRSIAGLLLVGTAALLAGCKPEPRTERTSLSATNSAANSRPARETLDELEARLDATVWRDEVLAQKYERTFVKLGDAIRSATNKLAALTALDFDSILLPKPKGSPRHLGLSISQQQFEPSTDSLPVAAWRQTLANLSASGWRLSGAESYHEKFIPPRGGTNAWSEFSFEIFGDRLAGRVRFILKGAFAVE